MKRSYYSSSLTNLRIADEDAIFGALSRAHAFALEDLQKNAWLEQIHILKTVDIPGNAWLLFEYAIPRMGKRVDNVLLYNGVVFVVEFKIDASTYHRHDLEQTLDYALDLKNFHGASHDVPIVPILVATDAPSVTAHLTTYLDRVCAPVRVNRATLAQTIIDLSQRLGGEALDATLWEGAPYKPTPTIIEAAQALYSGHDVKEISRSDAANLSEATDAIGRIIERAKGTHTKCICFLTGVPGAGKTLAGLNLATERHRADEREHAVFLSGNGPLVVVLQEALARFETKTATVPTRKTEALARTKTFIQNIHHFRDDSLMDVAPPIERVAIFDEAQRAWTEKQTTQFMKQKKGFLNFNKSEPEFLIEIMDRHTDWAVIVCLIGGGQEINTGEAGLPEWFRALANRFTDWRVHISDRLTEYEFGQGDDLYATIGQDKLHPDKALHLATSIRSFRSDRVSAFVKALLDVDEISARQLKAQFSETYPIVLTRDLTQAKEWLRQQARGTERFGLVASSGAHRLRPEGITVKAKIDPAHWFLNPDNDVRSSFYLEEVATEFDIQGLELDWTLVAWDADLRFVGGHWQFNSFSGTRWQAIHDNTRRRYLVNAYRVLLTRARQGMVIFVPPGNDHDHTRPQSFYDGTYEYLKSLGIATIAAPSR